MRSDVWYTIDGRRVSGKPTQKGLYIVNGKKKENMRILFHENLIKIPSHTHMTSLKPLYTERLRHVRENESPSRYPHILGHINLHHK